MPMIILRILSSALIIGFIERVYNMRVNEPNRASMIHAYNKANKTQSSKEAKARMGKDEVQISSEALELLKQLEDVEAPVRAEKVNELKKQIENGTYHVPSDKIAEKFLSFWKKP
jgi:negative regulator of flagellin synthesis FlgM